MSTEIPVDVDAYAAEYTGRTAITRLLYVSKHGSSESVRLRAVLIAIRRVKTDTLDYELYGNLVDELISCCKSLQGGPDASAIASTGIDFDGDFADLKQEISGRLDDEWLSLTSQRVKKEADKLEAEMRNYSVNLIKESIRLTHHAQAVHARASGNMEAALKSYTQTRDFNSSPQHDLDSSIGIIEISLDTGAFTHTLPAIARAEYAIDRLKSDTTSLAAGGVPVVSNGGSSNAPAAIIMTGAQAREKQRRLVELDEMSVSNGTKLRVARGILKLCQGPSQWKSAARELGAASKLDDWEGKVISLGDVALYTTLAGLATLNRSAIKTILIDNPQMRQFMDYGSCGYTRELVDCYMHARYKRLMEILQENKPRHLIDPYLRPIIMQLEDHILQNALVQYLEPYTNADLSRMMSTFGQNPDDDKSEIVTKLAGLIKADRLHAKLDLVTMAVQAVLPDPRKSLYTEALAAGSKVQETTRKTMLHMQLVESGLTLDSAKAPNKKKPNKKRGN